MLNINKKNNKGQEGVSIFLALVIMSVLLAVVLGLNTILIGQMKISREMGYSVNAFYAADTGIEVALYNLRQEEIFPWQDQEYGYQVVIYPCDKTCIKSVGTYRGVQRAIEAIY